MRTKNLKKVCQLFGPPWRSQLENGQRQWHNKFLPCSLRFSAQAFLLAAHHVQYVLCSTQLTAPQVTIRLLVGAQSMPVTRCPCSDNVSNGFHFPAANWWIWTSLLFGDNATSTNVIHNSSKQTGPKYNALAFRALHWQPWGLKISRPTLVASS